MSFKAGYFVTIFRLELCFLHGEVTDNTMGLFCFRPVFRHLILKSTAHFLHIGLKEKIDKGSDYHIGRRKYSMQLLNLHFNGNFIFLFSFVPINNINVVLMIIIF